MCPSCCLLPRLWILHWPIFYPCLSGIWCACCCLGMAHEFSPKSSVLGIIVGKLCAPTRLLIDAGCQFFFFPPFFFSPLKQTKPGNRFAFAFYVNMTCHSLHFERYHHLIPPKTTASVNLKHYVHVCEIYDRKQWRGKSPLQDRSFHLLIWWVSSWISGLRHTLLCN